MVLELGEGWSAAIATGLTESFQAGTYSWIPYAVVAGLVVLVLLIFVLTRGTPLRLPSLEIFRSLFSGKKPMDDESFNKIIEAAGYAYNSEQDIFYSIMDPWQREQGYCRLYDEAAAPFGMIIDCEPVYFEYEGKRWLIEFWKGQYDLCTGCEIGVYTTNGPDLNIPGIFNDTFYHAASDEDRLDMSFTLKKNGKTLFSRRAKHWWLTGFKLGEYSEPSELTLKLSITLKTKEMRNVFIEGLNKAGYKDEEIIVSGYTVSLKFREPHTPQPITRTSDTDMLIQKKNKLMCDKYQEVTGDYDNILDKVNALREKAPDLYDEIFKIGKPRELFKKYDKIRKLSK